MIRIKLAQFLCLLAAVVFCASLARAQGVRVFVMGSGSYLQADRFFTNTSNQRFQSSYATGGKVTFGGELSLANIIGVEGSYGYGRNNLRMANLNTSQTLAYGVRTQRISANLMAHSPISFLGLRPYATGGLEYDHLGPTDQANRLAFTQGFAGQSLTLGGSNQVGVNYGGGGEFSFFPTLALRLDLRDHITGTPKFGLSTLRYPVSGATHNVEFSVGLVFHIGK
jgi:hypothetical protein